MNLSQREFDLLIICLHNQEITSAGTLKSELRSLREKMLRARREKLS